MRTPHNISSPERQAITKAYFAKDEYGEWRVATELRQQLMTTVGLKHAFSNFGLALAVATDDQVERCRLLLVQVTADMQKADEL